MRLSTFIAGAAVLVVFGVLGFRILDLEQRVAALSPHADAVTSVRQVSVPSAPSNGCEARVAALETRLNSLSTEGLPRRAPEASELYRGLPSEDAILSVVERENSRVREVQLEWGRARWTELRQQQLIMFATLLKLEPAQTAELDRAITHEIDSMVDVMKRPNFAAEPDQVASDWDALLAETDKRAAAVLTPEQQKLWWQGRLFERQTFWPWLPKESTAHK